jgi:hypothetical protein
MWALPALMSDTCLALAIKVALRFVDRAFRYTWSDNKIRDLIAVKVLHNSLLKTTVITFKVLPLGNCASVPAPSPPFKTILELVL